MRQFAGRLVFIAIVGISVGCGDGVNPASPFKGKLDAAIAINEAFSRDTALVSVAKEAAAGGDADVTRAALRHIGESFTRDQAAAAAALKLGKAGKSVEATQVAKSIGESFLRDSTLSRLAKSEYGE